MNVDSKDLIKKTILYSGSGDTNFSSGSKITFHIKVQILENDEVLDDSRKWKDPGELILGKKFKLEVLESILSTMKLNEVSKFQIDKKLLASYPLVAKTLRDHDAKKLGKKIEPQPSHCCGQGINPSLGYSDLDEYSSNPKDLALTIEIVKVESPDSYEKDFWAMSEDEQKNSIRLLRERGNSLYKERKYYDAAKQYAEAIGRLENFMLREKPHDMEWNMLNTEKMPFLLNYSQCKLLLGEYYSVIEHCTEVLKFEPENIKALYRRGKAYVNVFSGEEARNDIEKVMKLDPALFGGCKKLLDELAKSEKEKLNQDKKVYHKLFS